MFTGWHHTNINVSDLDRSLDFYTRVLGLKVTGETEFDGEEFDRGVGLPGTKIRAAFLEVPNSSEILEMFQYVTPSSKPIAADALPNDIGVGHICFAVDDIDQTYENLLAQGVEFRSPPVTISKDHPKAAGVRFCYFRDPDGILIEILQRP
jgi:catechol 2,3-dioxygenase-like lactoylglutathione lyase family enzyme